MKNKKVLIGVGVLVLVLGGAVFMLGPSLLGGEAEAVIEETEPEPGTSVIYQMPERIVNLAPGGDQQYAKIKVALEFDVELEDGGGHGGDPAKAFSEEIDKVIPIVEDKITCLINTSTSTDLASPEGKDELKLEI